LKRNLRYLTVWVISNRPLRFIIATLVACLPLMSFANPQVDSVQVHTEVAHETTEKARKERIEPTDVKSEIKAFIGHHVLILMIYFSVRREKRSIMVSLPIILWDNGIHLSSRFNHERQQSNGNFYVINHHDGKIYKTDASGTLTEEQMVIQRMLVRLIFNH
jgi:F-type H+-transporting ATPase subunit a